MLATLIAVSSIMATQAVSLDTGHILVIRTEADTVRYALDETIELQVGETVALRPVVFDAAGSQIPAEDLWWHNTSHGLVVFPEVDESRIDGTGNEPMRGERTGREEVMLHWSDGNWLIAIAVQPAARDSP